MSPLNASLKRRLHSLSKLRPDLKLTHYAYLGYVGPSRPKVANSDIVQGQFGLEEYLKERGITTQEFILLRKSDRDNGNKPKSKMDEFCEAVSQMPPGMGLMGQGPGSALPGFAIEAGVNIVKTQRATKLAAKAMLMKSDTDPQIDTMLGNMDEVEVNLYVVQFFCLKRRATQKLE